MIRPILLVLPLVAIVVAALTSLRQDRLGLWAVPLYVLAAGTLFTGIFVLVIASGVISGVLALFRGLV